MFIILVATLIIATSPLQNQGAQLSPNDDWIRLNAIVGGIKTMKNRIVENMRSILKQRQLAGCMKDLHELQRVVTTQSQFYMREMAIVVNTLYKETETFKEQEQGMCKSHCQANQWMCKNEQCILLSQVCDGKWDCIDTSDEPPFCLAGCGPDRFRCRANSMCLPSTARCDGIQHCSDGTDEQCQLICAHDEFLCYLDRRCVPSNWICDGEPDCSNGEDERLCSQDVKLRIGLSQVLCEVDQFMCIGDNICLDASLRCNGVLDCSDTSDELDCPAVTPPPTTPTTTTILTPLLSICSPDEFRCINDDMCVSFDLLCNGIDNCFDGSDEQLCPETTTQFSCDGDQIFCLRDSRCLDANLRCNGVWDCSDTSDELDCPAVTSQITTSSTSTASTPLFPICSPDEFRCTSDDMCVSFNLLCNGVANCFDGSDEERCPETTSSTRTTQSGEITPDLRLGETSTTTALVPITFDIPTTTTASTATATTTTLTTTTTTTTNPVTTATTSTTTSSPTTIQVEEISCPDHYFPCTKERCVHEGLVCLPIATNMCTHIPEAIQWKCKRCGDSWKARRYCISESRWY